MHLQRISAISKQIYSRKDLLNTIEFPYNVIGNMNCNLYFHSLAEQTKATSACTHNDFS